MKSATYPLAITEDLLTEVRQTSVETGLSMADAMRQSMRIGLPRLRKQLAPGRRPGLPIKPLTKAEAKKAFAPDVEWDRLERAMVQRPVPRFEED